MSQYYNQDYTREQMNDILQAIQDCVRESRFYIATNENRQENKDFINEYRLTHERQQAILLAIKVEDFCHTLQNTKAGYEHEVLYVFCHQVTLTDFEGNEGEVDIYTKFNVIEISEGKRVVIISFHKPNKTIRYLFR